MKKNYITRLGALALTLTFITTCMLGSTLARYVSEAVGTAKANIAAWKVVMKSGSDEIKNGTFDLTLAGTKVENDLVSSGAVAPGDTGVFEISLDGSGSEVAYDYTISIDSANLTETAGNIKFYTDAQFSTEWKDVEATRVEAGSGAEVKKEVYWRWLGDEGDTQNANDTTAGIAAAATDAADLEFTVKMTAKQVISGNP